jgi:hypothetical protein
MEWQMPVGSPTKAHIVCVVDKWDETEPEKGHKLSDVAMRCVFIDDDPAVPKTTEECVGNTNTCLTDAGRAPERAPTPLKAATGFM